MINNYKTFLLENVSMKLDMVIDIIKSLKGDENKELVNRLINYSDKNGKTVLMSIVQSNNQELIDYILKFDIDLQAKDKKGKNVLFYCKNIKTFKKFYDLGVDPTAKMAINKKSEHGYYEPAGHKNILNYLSSKNLFNVEIYQKLIKDGVSINDKDVYGNSVIVYSILNKGIVQLLIKNGADIEDIEIQYKMFKRLFDSFKYHKPKRVLIRGIFKILFDNNIDFNMHDFTKEIVELDTWYGEKMDVVDDFIKPLIKYFSEKKLLSLTKHYLQISSNSIKILDFAKRILSLGIYSTIFSYFKDYYRMSSSFDEIAKYYIMAHPYLDDVEKFNL